MPPLRKFSDICTSAPPEEVRNSRVRPEIISPNTISSGLIVATSIGKTKTVKLRSRSPRDLLLRVSRSF